MAIASGPKWAGKDWNVLSISNAAEKLKKEKRFGKTLVGSPVAKYIQKNVDTFTIISATFGFCNFPDNFVCN